MMRVQEMFFSVHVSDMQRALTFYANALGATVDFASPTWSSLLIAGIRVSLVLRPHEPSASGIHLIVDDVALGCAAVMWCGGQVAPAIEGSHGSVIVEATDTEGNTFTLRQRRVIRNAVQAPSGESTASHAA